MPNDLKYHPAAGTSPIGNCLEKLIAPIERSLEMEIRSLTIKSVEIRAAYLEDVVESEEARETNRKEKDFDAQNIYQKGYNIEERF